MPRFNAAGQVTNASQVVVAYAENDPTAGTPTISSLLSGSAVLVGLHGAASAQFAKQVVAEASTLGINKNEVSVTGHSLGGADAEYAAKATGLGGMTFGAPGIRGQATAASNLTNYVDEVDPIGNFALDEPFGQAAKQASENLAKAYLDKNLPADISAAAKKSIEANVVTAIGAVNFNHYGGVKPVGPVNKQSAGLEKFFSDTISKLPDATLANIKTVLGLPLVTLLHSPAFSVTVGAVTVKGIANFNGVAQYAKDLGVTLYPVCFASGTRIRTERGDVAVEALRIGYRVVTSSGRLREVRWLGHRTLESRKHPHPAAVMPIRIAAHAFGKNRPARDLDVSPGHAICVDVGGEVLIPAAALVNGTSIRQVSCDAVTYWHVELESHDILLAEGLPAESYLEMGNRGFFKEADVVSLGAEPDGRGPTHADFCRPYHDHGPLLDAVRAMLNARARDCAIGLPEHRGAASGSFG